MSKSEELGIIKHYELILVDNVIDVYCFTKFLFEIVRFL